MWESLAGHACTVDSGVAGAGRVVTIDCFLVIFGNIFYWLLIAAGIVALFFIIFSGLKFITSSGDAKKADSARKTLLFSVIGLALVFISFGIIAFIGSLTGVGCINTFGFGQCVPGEIHRQCTTNRDCAPPFPRCSARGVCVEI